MCGKQGKKVKILVSDVWVCFFKLKPCWFVLLLMSQLGAGLYNHKGVNFHWRNFRWCDKLA